METTPRILTKLRRKAMSCLSEFQSYLEFGTLHDRISKAVCTKIVMSKLSHTYKTKKIKILKWIWEMNAKPYTEKQKAKNKTCIQPSVTNFPQADLKRKKKKTNNRCLLAQIVPPFWGSEWRILPLARPLTSLNKWLDWWQKSILKTWVW